MPRRTFACGKESLIPDATIHRTAACGSAPHLSLFQTAHGLRAARAFRKRFAIFGPRSGVLMARRKQCTGAMAAVFALVFLFVLAAGGLLLKVFVAEATPGSVLAMITFMGLGSGVFLGLFKMSRGWESEAP